MLESLGQVRLHRMEIRNIPCQHPILTKFVKNIYFLDRKPEDEELSYLAFPSVSTPFAFSHNSELKAYSRGFMVSHNQKADKLAILGGRWMDPIEVRYRGPIRELAINFQPLGLCRFIKGSFQEEVSGLVNQKSKFCNYWQEHFFINEKVNDQDLLNRAEELLLDLYRELDLSELDKMIEMMPGPLTLNEIAEELGVNYRTLYRRFLKYSGFKAKNFRKILRFRQSTKDYMKANTPIKLTDLSQMGNYYDQAHFIRDFKQLTGLTPGQFFNVISEHIGENYVQKSD